MLRRIFLLMLTAFWSCLAIAEWDPTRASLSAATDRMRQAQRQSQDCPPGNRCNHLQFLQNLETRDYQSRFFGLLKSRAPSCQVAVDKTKNPKLVNRFSNANELANHFARRFPEIGNVNNQRIGSCASSNDASSRYKVAKFYTYMKRFNEGATRAVEELSAINQLLGQNDPLPCEGRGVIDQAFNRCQELSNACRAGASQLAAAAKQSETDEKTYLDAKAEVSKQQRCLSLASDYKKHAGQLSAANPSIQKCDQVFVERQAPRKICTTYTWEHKQKMAQCQTAIDGLLTAMSAIEANNPWFRSENYFEYRKTKNVQESIRSQLTDNRRELKKKVREFRDAGLCINGFQASQACNDNKVRALLAATPEIPIAYGGDQKRNVGNLYLEAQSCIEEGVRDQNETAKILNTSARDAVLTIATAGLSGVAMGAKAAWTLRGAGALAAAGTVVGINSFYFSHSYSEAKKACGRQEQKLNVAAQSLGKECPGPNSNVSQAQREHANCMMARSFAALDALPFVPLSTAIRATSRLAKMSRGTPEARVDTPAPVATPELARSSVVRPARPAVRAARPEGRTGRQGFVREYVRKPATTPEQNEEWIRLSKASPNGQTVFLDVQNSAMKHLNDTTADKDLVSALTNRNLEIVSQKVKGVLDEFPTVEAVPYSDFKGIRYAFRPKPPATKMPAGFDEKLKAAMAAGNKEFADFVAQSKLVSGTENPAGWFSYGYGNSAALANVEARQAGRSVADNLQRTEGLRQGLARELSGTGLMDDAADSSSLRTDVFELSRKAASADDLQAQLARTGQPVTTAQAQSILDYSRAVNDFTPGNYIVRRENASLTDAVHGGVSFDFKGIGAQNLKETAEAIAGQRGVGSAVENARIREGNVTAQLNQRKAAVRDAVQEVAERNGLKLEVRVSGDDMVVIPNRPLTAAERTQLAQAVAGKVDPSSIRMSSIPSGIPSSQRAALAATGENIEKQLRSNLQGHIPKDKLDRLLFSVDMQAGKSDAVATLNTVSRNVELTAAERRQIDEAFERAVAKNSPRATPDEMARNAALPPKEKVQAFEDANNLPRGYASNNPRLVDEVGRIENQYPTPVSGTPALRRPRAEREALVAKRNELRRLGFTDQQIRRGMDQGIFGAPNSSNLVASYGAQRPRTLGEVNSLNIPGSNYVPVDLSKASVRPMPRSSVDELKSSGTQAGGTRYSEIAIDGETLGVFTKVLPRQKTGFIAQGTKTRTEAEVAHEAYMTRLLSDLGYGPRYLGSRALPNGDFEISTVFNKGVDFNMNSRVFEKKVQAVTMEQLERAEKIALDLNARGIYSKDLQFMVSGGKVQVIDPERFELMDNAARLIGRRESILSEFKDLKEARRRWEAANPLSVHSAMPDAELARVPAAALPKMKEANQSLANRGINPEGAEYQVLANGNVVVTNVDQLRPLRPHQRTNAINEADLDVDAIAELNRVPHTNSLTYPHRTSPAPEFKNGVAPAPNPSIAASFQTKFGRNQGTFYRGIRVPKGAKMDDFYVRSDGLGSMVSTNPADAVHYGRTPAGLTGRKLNSDDDVLLISYELKPQHIQEDTYGTMEHVFMNPNVNLTSPKIGYRAIRVPAAHLDNPKLVEQYLQQLRSGK